MAKKGNVPWIKGKHHSEKTKQKISELQKNGGFHLGKRLSEEAKRKTALAKMGERNPRWNEGASEYPNHALMKKARIEVFKKANAKCMSCNKEAKEIHHIDRSKDNHDLKNLAALCSGCHKNLHIEYLRRLG